jgi:plasmid stabilization system protein ParE
LPTTNCASAELGVARVYGRGSEYLVNSRFVVFYRVTETAIEIVRVLDERRDVQRIFPRDD